MKNKLIAFMGVPGSGKTTAATLLANKEFSLFEEDFKNNAFLNKYYLEMERWAFHSQMYFLINKVKQYEKIDRALIKNHVVLDLPICQDIVYAQTIHRLGNMPSEEWLLYYDVFLLLNKKLKNPDLTIYLKISPQIAISRVLSRGREYEKDIDKEYLLALQASIENFITDNSIKSDFITLNVDHVNLVSSEQDISKFIKEVKDSLWRK